LTKQQQKERQIANKIKVYVRWFPTGEEWRSGRGGAIYYCLMTFVDPIFYRGQINNKMIDHPTSVINVYPATFIQGRTMWGRINHKAE